MNFMCKHIMRLKNTLYRRYKMLTWKFQYGDSLIAKKFHFRDNFHIYIEEDGLLIIGENVFFNNNCSITTRKKITIGKNCIFGENVKIYDHNHKFKDTNKPIYQQGFSSEEVMIEEDCWIASDVIILKGVHIGKHSVIGAGVVVYKNIPSHSVVICNQNLKYYNE